MSGLQAILGRRSGLKELTVFKLDENGEHVWQYPALELERDDHSVRLEAFFNRDDLDLGFATFARGRSLRRIFLQ